MGLYIVVFLGGMIAGFALHVVMVNYALIKKGLHFWNEKKK